MPEFERRFKIREPVSILKADEKRRIHESALDLLETVGIMVHSDVARGSLKAAGALVDDGSKVVKFPAGLVQGLIQTVPSTVILAGRTEEYDLPVDGTHYYFTTDGCGVQVYDAVTGTRRASVLEDIRRTAVIADWLPYLSVYEPMVVASDAPSDQHVLRGMKEAMENTTKHIETESTTTTEEAKAQVEMAAQVVGSKETLLDRHYISAMVCTVSPLVLEGPATDVAMVWAENHVPIHITGMAEMGLTGPATIAGGLVLNHAETLGMACAIQAHEPGAPLLYGSVLSSMDPMSGAIDFGSPETIRLALGSTEMARYMKWPGSCGGIGPGAIVPGIQATIENALMAMSAAMVGSEVMNGIGLLDNSTVLAYEQLLIDNEMVGHTLGICKEVEFTPETLALDVIKKVGINRTYLTERHTMKHVREFHKSALWSREGFDAWEKGGRKDTLTLARQKVDRILSEHQPEPLSSEVSEKLGEIVGNVGK